MKKKIVVGSRESKLAILQTEIIIQQIKKYNKDTTVELKTMKTTGDKILDRTLDKIGGKGLFIKELERALLDGAIDISVHSLKDMPADMSDELPIVAYSKREDPRDVLVLPKGMQEIDYSKPVGSSSERRKRLFLKYDNKATVKPVRGNVITRLEKLDRGEFSALILAYAGIKRLGLDARISKVFETYEILPAAGQGILVIQGRKGEDFSYLMEINDKDAEDISLAERTFIKTLDGGCSSPTAAYAKLNGNELVLTGFYVNTKNNKEAMHTIVGDRKDAEKLGDMLAKMLLKEVRMLEEK